MARGPRQCPGGVVFHVLNRGVGRGQVFHKPADFDAFERCLAETLARWPGLRLLAYCLMPNHWHLVLRPAEDGQLGACWPASGGKGGRGRPRGRRSRRRFETYPLFFFLG